MQLTMRNKFQETVYDEKKIIFAAPLIYLNYTIDDSLKTVMLKNYLRTKFKDLAYQRKFTSHFV